MNATNLHQYHVDSALIADVARRLPRREFATWADLARAFIVAGGRIEDVVLMASVLTRRVSSWEIAAIAGVTPETAAPRGSRVAAIQSYAAGGFASQVAHEVRLFIADDVDARIMAVAIAALEVGP